MDIKLEPICDGSYLLGSGVTIMLPVEIPDLPESVECEGVHMVKRTEFHVSLVCMGEILKKHSISNEHFKEEVIEDFCAHIAQNSVTLARFRDEFRYMEYGEKKSLVVMVDVLNLDSFFDHLNEKYTLTLEHPQTHITLYTENGGTGIYLTDSDDLKERTQLTFNPGLQLPQVS